MLEYDGCIIMHALSTPHRLLSNWTFPKLSTPRVRCQKLAVGWAVAHSRLSIEWENLLPIFMPPVGQGSFWGGGGSLSFGNPKHLTDCL